MLPKTALPAALVTFGAEVLLPGCTGAQSALDPAGRGAEEIQSLLHWMTGGAVIVWSSVLALSLYAMRSRPEAGQRHASQLIIWGGAIIPTVALAVLLIFGLRLIPPLSAAAPEGSMRVLVTGEQWWWRVRYEVPGRAAFELANEIRLPVGEPVEFLLESSDVIHSFWIPSLGGKMDMIPGRRTRLLLHPSRTGVFRGVCAEYCGTSHALMAFPVVVSQKDEFTSWVEHQQRPSEEPREPLAARGRERFFANGCPACHSVRDTRARGTVGPDLTHVGSRLSLAAGTTPNGASLLARWIESPRGIKPGVHMPAFGMLPPAEVRAIAAYLQSLR